MTLQELETHPITHDEWEEILEKRHEAQKIQEYNDAFNDGVQACIDKVTSMSFINLQATLHLLKKV